MTTLGKVFTVLSFLLALGFMALVAPVAKRLVELQKDVLAIEFGGQDSLNRTHRKQEEIRQKTLDLDAERVKLIYDLNRWKTQETDVRTRAANQSDIVRSQLSTWNDMDKLETQNVVSWQDSLRDLKAEIEARTAEKERLSQDLVEFTAAHTERNQQVEDLRKILQSTRTELENTLESMFQNYEKLERLTESTLGEPDRIAADAR